MFCSCRSGRFQAKSGEDYFTAQNVPAEKEMRKLSNFFDVSQLEMAPDEGPKKKVKLTREQIEAFKDKKQQQKKLRYLARLAQLELATFCSN